RPARADRAVAGAGAAGVRRRPRGRARPRPPRPEQPTQEDPVTDPRPAPDAPTGGDDVIADVRRRLGEAVAPVVVGADEVLDALVVALAAGGHVLLEGVPGTAKTLVADAASRAL